MKHKRRRHLRQDELDLWRRVARSVRPLAPEPTLDPAAEPSPEAAAPEAGAPNPTPAIEFGSRRADAAVAATKTSDSLRAPAPAAAPASRLDGKVARNLSRGKMLPQARIDLHGMTLAQAHPALIRFVEASHERGLRLVLVITGKGRGDDGWGGDSGRGILKRQVPQWLASPPLNTLVLDLRAAHQRHGGSGAYYVYLSRRR